MQFLTILGIGFGVGILGGLVILWLDHRYETRKKLKDNDRDAAVDGRC
jgi:hypothetical protein